LNYVGSSKPPHRGVRSGPSRTRR